MQLSAVTWFWLGISNSLFMHGLWGWWQLRVGHSESSARSTTGGLEVVITEMPSEISSVAWQAVVKKDRRYDGRFVYAAVTTGIYCRPSCPARNPKRRNALIFLTSAEAEQ
jgi:hypothetical protein